MSGSPDCLFQWPTAELFFVLFLSKILSAVSANLSSNLNISRDKFLYRSLYCLFFEALKFIAELKLVYSVIKYGLFPRDSNLGDIQSS